MKNLKNYLLILSLIILTNCSNEDNESDNVTNNVQGTITLSGKETSEVGTSLKVENILVGGSQTGTSKSVTLLHKNVTIENGELNFTDPKNTFVIVATEFDSSDNSSVTKAISMAINVNGEEYKFACSTPEIGSFVSCGDNFKVDKNGKKVTFNNTTVVNTKSDEILTMNGTITWK